MTKVIIFTDEQFTEYKGKKVRLLRADNPPPGFIGERVNVIKARCSEGVILYNPNLCETAIRKQAEKMISDLRKNKFPKFKPAFPFQIEV